MLVSVEFTCGTSSTRSLFLQALLPFSSRPGPLHRLKQASTRAISLSLVTYLLLSSPFFIFDEFVRANAMYFSNIFLKPLPPKPTLITLPTLSGTQIDEDEESEEEKMDAEEGTKLL